MKKNTKKTAMLNARCVRVNRVLARAVAALVDERPELRGRVTYGASQEVHYVRAHPDEFEKVVRSLLDYATGFVGESARIELSLTKFTGRRHNDAGDYSTISIEIIDAVISAATLQALSKSYQKMNRMLSSNGGQLPELRLAKCSAVAAALGGNVWVRPKSERGLIFNLSLPLLKEVLVAGAVPCEDAQVRVVSPDAGSIVNAKPGAGV